MPSSFSTELIITTYNNPSALSLVLHSLVQQTHALSSICIADDGSNDVTKETITQLCYNLPEMEIRHVWHPDTGFNKNVILNKAIKSSTSDYLIFIDGAHEYNIVKNDIINCKNLAHNNTIVIMDDTIQNISWVLSWNIGPNKCWKEYIDNKLILQLGYKDFRPGRGCSWGKYIL